MATMDIQRMMLEGQLDEVKKGNPWDVYSIFEFNFFCCPECDCKTQSKQDFINHASTLHPWVSVVCCFVNVYFDIYLFSQFSQI